MSLLNCGDTAYRLRNFRNADLRARLRSEYFKAQKDNISAETKHRKTRKEIGTPAKEHLYKFQCRFRIEAERFHDYFPSGSGLVAAIAGDSRGCQQKSIGGALSLSHFYLSA